MLIGGAATLIHLEERSGKAQRKTIDLDVVVLDLSEDDKTDGFIDLFKTYIALNGYKSETLGDGKSQTFRYTNPITGTAPKVIEILSKRLDLIPLTQPTQRHIDLEMSSIALNSDFYKVVSLYRNKKTIETLGKAPISIATPTALILLKAFAYENLISSSRSGDQSKAQKQIQDIIRLASVLIETDAIRVNSTVYAPLKKIIETAELHFSKNRLISCGWTKHTKPSEIVDSISTHISLD